ncbi:MAG: hypothetical protein U9R21_09520 [Candidatus Thermoplasmatota archaeon]|nr:hypothetical protein [Candidatus Thermoplasmatota archaeon]
MEKHIESLKEVIDEIQTALQDPQGLQVHQRRLAFMLSVGIADLLELYFHKLGIMKPGAKIKHNWLKRNDIKERLERQISGDITKIEELDEIIEKCKTIERERNDIAYGLPLNDEIMLKQKIDEFLEIKEIIENMTGEKIDIE